MEPTSSESTEPSSSSPRRGFLTTAAASLAAAAAAVVPLAVAAVSLVDPLRRPRRPSEMVLVTRLRAVPPSGEPKRFTVSSTRTDAWTTHQASAVGAVYLRRTPDGLSALNVVCPHAGCFVDLAPDRPGFACPCHGSSFAIDGTIDDPASPSPRAMDALEVEVRNGDEVWVRFENFLPGRTRKTRV